MVQVHRCKRGHRRVKVTAIESGSSKKVDYIVSMLHEKCKVEEDPLIRQKAISVWDILLNFIRINQIRLTF